MGILCSSEKKEETAVPIESAVVNSRAKLQHLIRCRGGIDSQMFGLSQPWITGTANENIHLVYQTLESIGEGYIGKVTKARLKVYPKMMYAIKTIKKSSSVDKNFKYFKTEVDMLKEVDHPNIAKFFECYQDQQNFYMVLELCEGPDLVKVVEAHKGLPEPLVKRFFFQALLAVNYLHQVGIVHRDIKLDNFLLTSKDVEKSSIRLIDFGFAKKFREGQLTSQVGTPWYVAPEILDKGKPYTQACDNWSLGVMLYIMLFAEPPFKGRNTQQILQSITSSYLNLSDSKHSRISPEMLHLLSILLEKNPENRAKLSDALHSNCFYPIYHIPEFYWGVSEKKKIVKKIQKAKQQSRFAHEAIKIMVKVFSNTPEFKEYMNAFFLCDLLSRGVLAQDEIKQLFADADMVIDERKDFKKLGCLSFKNKTAVTCTEFIAGMLDRNFFQDQPKLKLVFSRFDLENKGYITAENIKSSFHRFGYELSNETISDMVKEFGADNEGNIRFDLFEKVMKKVR